MGKNLARMEMQIFLEEFTKRLPHMELVPDQEFTYLPNTSFRGPDHVWVQWDPEKNPERSDPSILDDRRPVKIGEPSKTNISRTVSVDALTTAADGVLRVRLSDPSGKALPRWTPGSHIDVELGDLSRQYSLCSDPNDLSHYEIAVLEEPESRGGSRYVHRTLQVGHTLKMRGPRNHFKLDAEARRYIFVAGGIGVTPIVAMADHAKATGKDYEIHYCGRDVTTMALLDRLTADHGDKLTVHAAAAGNRLDIAALLATPTPGTQIYSCGPERLLTALEDATAHWPEESLHVEHFTSNLATLDPADEHAFEVELRDSGLTIQVAADQTVLDALRASNIDIQSDCEEGLCGSCEAPVLDGEVDHRDMVLTKTERAQNKTMMTCCSRACGKKITLAL